MIYFAFVNQFDNCYLGWSQKPHRRSPCAGSSTYVKVGVIIKADQPTEIWIEQFHNQAEGKYLAFVSMP